MVVFLLIPTMIAARLVGTGNTGLGHCLAASLIAIISSNIVESFMPDRLVLASAIQFVISTFLFMLILRTSLIKGAIVSALLLAIQFAAIVGLAKIGYAYFH
jgi:hypothetical protein